MQRVLLDEACDDDAEFIDALLRYWGVADLPALRQLVIDHEFQDYRDTKRSFGGMAKLITAAAPVSPLARAACDEAVGKLATGIRLLGKCFTESEVRAVLIGSLARCAAISEPLAAVLAAQSEKHYRIIEPVLPPVAGAVLLALTHGGVTIDAGVTERLRFTKGDTN
jgi:glucosamine kinase